AEMTSQQARRLARHRRESHRLPFGSSWTRSFLPPLLRLILVRGFRRCEGITAAVRRNNESLACAELPRVRRAANATATPRGRRPRVLDGVAPAVEQASIPSNHHRQSACFIFRTVAIGWGR